MRTARRASDDGCVKLASAVLEQALRDLGNANHLVRDGAIAWVRSEDDSSFYGFEGLCCLLDYNAAWLRKEMLNDNGRRSEKSIREIVTRSAAFCEGGDGDEVREQVFNAADLGVIEGV